MSDSKNNIAWHQVFNKYALLNEISDNGFALVKAIQLNEFREARLMTKFDHHSQVPNIFLKNSLSILPITRGSYLVGKFETFHKFEKNDVNIVQVPFPSFLETLNYREITSEATAINCAFIAEILNDFTGEEELYPTVSGRMGSSIFNFNVKTPKGFLSVDVENSQIEIDGGYEGNASLALIEAKNYISDDFLVRQLYYPYRLWSGKVNKQVRPIFLTYSNGIFHLREYVFDDANVYNSIRLIKEKKYSVQDTTINMELIEHVVYKTETVKEPEVPFPQADSFERVINLSELLYDKGILLKDYITGNYDFDARQTDYYTRALMYLGIASKVTLGEKGIGFKLTNSGRKLFSMTLVDRQVEFIKLILSHAPFNRVLELHLKKGVMPTIGEIVEIMKECKVYNVTTESTYRRRASTIKGWVNWILSNITE